VIIVGLTGSIAMGKTTVAGMFAALGCPVFDADVAVGELYRSERAEVVEREFPGVRVDGEINRARLAARVLGDADALRRLEAIVHPIVAASRQAFLQRARADSRRAAVVDVPLLFETGGDRAVDVVLVVSADEQTQRARALAREGMTEGKLQSLLARQMPNAEKRRRAHFIIETDHKLEATRKRVEAFIRATVAMPGKMSQHA
jgi:dephospho-CoA kinase